MAHPKTTSSDPSLEPGPTAPPRRNSGIIQRARLEDVLAVGAGEAMKPGEDEAEHAQDPAPS